MCLEGISFIIKSKEHHVRRDLWLPKRVDSHPSTPDAFTQDYCNIEMHFISIIDWYACQITSRSYLIVLLIKFLGSQVVARKPYLI